MQPEERTRKHLVEPTHLATGFHLGRMRSRPGESWDIEPVQSIYPLPQGVLSRLSINYIQTQELQKRTYTEGEVFSPILIFHK